MRKLKTSDVPSFCRCLKKLGVRETTSHPRPKKNVIGMVGILK